MDIALDDKFDIKIKDGAFVMDSTRETECKVAIGTNAREPNKYYAVNQWVSGDIGNLIYYKSQQSVLTNNLRNEIKEEVILSLSAIGSISNADIIVNSSQGRLNIQAKVLAKNFLIGVKV